MTDQATIDTEPAPPPSARSNTLAAARIWISAETKNPDIYEAVMARRVWNALTQGKALGDDAHKWLMRRRDSVHRNWAAAILEALKEANDGT